MCLKAGRCTIALQKQSYECWPKCVWLKLELSLSFRQRATFIYISSNKKATNNPSIKCLFWMTIGLQVKMSSSGLHVKQYWLQLHWTMHHGITPLCLSTNSQSTRTLYNIFTLRIHSISNANNVRMMQYIQWRLQATERQQKINN